MIESVELVIRQPGHPDRVVRLPEGTTGMGRAEDNDVVLSDVGVSRRHATIMVGRNDVTIEDLGSGNGTYYNGYRVKSQSISDGDEVVIDPFVLQFRVKGQVATARGGEDGDSPARLEVVVGTGMAGSSYPITTRGLTIGRSEDRDVVLPDPACSRHHVTVLRRGNDYIMRDEGSANGAFVNAVRVRECTLNDGDMIRIGNTEMRFVLYARGSGENTTQLVKDNWNDRWEDEAPARRRRGRPWLTMILGGIVAALGLAVVIVVVAVIVVIAVRGGVFTDSAPPPRPPAWALELPAGLEAAKVDALFSEGVESMRSGDDRAALQNFYRVLLADPGHASAEKFAFAAGEHLVVQALQEEFDAARTKRAAVDQRREKLLKDYKRGGSRGRKAKAELLKDHADHPDVKERLKLPESEADKAIAAKLEEGAEKQGKGDASGAARAYANVLGRSKDDTQRATALAGLKAATKELALQTRENWAKAVMLQAEGNDAEARALFAEMSTADSNNVSARLHGTAIEARAGN